MSSTDPSTHYSPCFGLLLSGSPALTHTHTHSLETGCVQAYAPIDGAFVCNVQSWRFEASLFFFKKQTRSIWLDVTWYLHIIYIYKNIYLCYHRGFFLYATLTLRVDFKVTFWRRLKYSMWCSCASPGVMTTRNGFVYKIPLNSHSWNKKSSPSKGFFSCTLV